MNMNASPPLRLHVLSDLHFGVVPAWFRLAPGADVMVVAGEFRQVVDAAIEVLRRIIPRPTPIVLVAGKKGSGVAVGVDYGSQGNALWSLR